MIFNYIFTPHSIDEIQVWLEHLVKNVWCRPRGKYSLDLLHPTLKSVIEEILNDNSISKDYLDGPIRRIDNLIRTHLKPSQRKQIILWFDHNNDIESICAGNTGIKPINYNDISKINTELAEELKSFCTSLWNDVLNLSAVRNRIGSIRDHFQKAFAVQNRSARCPYCGYRETMGVNHSYRDAYDHYLPKGTYPFNTVNFHNLSPMCDWCNSKYKLSRDPTQHLDPITRKNTGQRIKAFYPYSTIPSGITIVVTINTADIKNLSPDDIELDINSVGRTEEVEGWKVVFGIEERYKAKYCSDSDGLAWFTKIIEDGQYYDLTPQELLVAEIRSANERPLVDSNFLKVPFLQACNNAGLIP